MLDLLFFECDNIRYAVTATDVESVVWLPALSPVDGVPAWCAGHLNWHGAPVPVIDLGRLLGHAPRSYVLSDQLIIVKAGEKTLALLVTRVDLLNSVNEVEMVKGLPSGDVPALPFRAEIREGDRLVMLIDTAALAHALAGVPEPLETETPVAVYEHVETQRFLERMHRLAEIRVEGSAAGRASFALVRIGERTYAIPLEQVVEFAHLQHCTPLPSVPDFIVGCMNLRGDILTVVDLDRFIKAGQIATGKELVVLASAGKKLAIRVAGVERMVESDEQAIQAIGDTDELHPLARNLLHLPDSLAAILDVETLFCGNLLDVFEEV